MVPLSVLVLDLILLELFQLLDFHLLELGLTFVTHDLDFLSRNPNLTKDLNLVVPII